MLLDLFNQLLSLVFGLPLVQNQATADNMKCTKAVEKKKNIYSNIPILCDLIDVITMYPGEHTSIH